MDEQRSYSVSSEHTRRQTVRKWNQMLSILFLLDFFIWSLAGDASPGIFAIILAWLCWESVSSTGQFTKWPFSSIFYTSIDRVAIWQTRPIHMDDDYGENNYDYVLFMGYHFLLWCVCIVFTTYTGIAAMAACGAHTHARSCHMCSATGFFYRRPSTYTHYDCNHVFGRFESTLFVCCIDAIHYAAVTKLDNQKGCSDNMTIEKLNIYM